MFFWGYTRQIHNAWQNASNLSQIITWNAYNQGIWSLCSCMLKKTHAIGPVSILSQLRGILPFYAFFMKYTTGNNNPSSLLKKVQKFTPRLGQAEKLEIEERRLIMVPQLPTSQQGLIIVVFIRSLGYFIGALRNISWP